MKAIICDRCGKAEAWPAATFQGPFDEVLRRHHYPSEIHLCGRCADEMRLMLRKWAEAGADAGTGATE